ncbi:hypothetical protein MNB_SV-3-830 [hydrothermal vent metagenome]|uniref:Uncharacterized protein n=1 Tax=hydrothermal vent metagenome TaxID=652676 RepID=A0A1W1CWR2_9ZZZZ
MEKKIAQAVEKIQNATHITDAEKPFILEKIEEWKEERTAISELNNKLQELWLKVEPIFAEIGIV